MLLLLEHLADPTKVDAQGKTPYDLCATKALRRTFRLFAGREGHETLWPWSKAHVEPLREEDEREQAERKKRANKDKRAREKRKKEERREAEARARQEEEQQQAQERALQEARARAQQLSNLSEREKRALAAESRLAKLTGTAKPGTCEMCAAPLPPKAFEVLFLLLSLAHRLPPRSGGGSRHLLQCLCFIE